MSLPVNSYRFMQMNQNIRTQLHGLESDFTLVPPQSGYHQNLHPSYAFANFAPPIGLISDRSGQQLVVTNGRFNASRKLPYLSYPVKRLQQEVLNMAEQAPYFLDVVDVASLRPKQQIEKAITLGAIGNIASIAANAALVLKVRDAAIQNL